MPIIKRINIVGAEPIPEFLQLAIRDFKKSLNELIAQEQILDCVNIDLILDQSEKIKNTLKGNSEGYIIFSEGYLNQNGKDLHIYLKSISYRGLMYGLYGFLYELGIRWYFPGEKYILTKEYSTFKKILLSGMNIKTIPAFKKRGIVIYNNNSFFTEWLRFSIRNRMNHIALHSEEGLGKSEQIYENYGLNLSLEEHLFDNRVCAYKSEDFSRAYKKVKQKMEKIPHNPHQDEKELYFWLADTVIRNCSCSQHQGWNSGEVYLDLVNHLLQKLNEDHKNYKFSWLAYLGSFKPIRNLEPLPNVILEIAPMHRCFNHSINDSKCEINLNKVFKPIEKLKNRFKPENRQILGYWLDSSLFGREEYLLGGWATQKERGRIPHIPFVMKKDFQYYYRNNFKNILSFAVNLDKEYFETFTSPMVFLYTLLAWDPNIKIEEELKNFNQYYLGLPRTYPFYLKDEYIDPKEIRLNELRTFLSQWNELMDYIKKNHQKIQEKLGKAPYFKRIGRLILEFHKLDNFREKYLMGRLMGYIWQNGLKILEQLFS